MLGDEVLFEPDLVDGGLRTDELVAHVVLLVVGVLHQYLALGEP